ncbi:MAG TPA: hypothetical protein VGC87_24280 [Pyrinomonadaceae bacterium]
MQLLKLKWEVVPGDALRFYQDEAAPARRAVGDDDRAVVAVAPWTVCETTRTVAFDRPRSSRARAPT